MSVITQVPKTICHIGILEKAKSWFGTVALFFSYISFITALNDNSAVRKTELEKGHSTQPKQENWEISLREMVLKRKHHHLKKLKTDTTHFMFCVCITYVNEILQIQESMGELTQSSSHKGLYIRVFHWHCQRPVNHIQIFSRTLLQSTQKNWILKTVFHHDPQRVFNAQAIWDAEELLHY